MLIAYKRMEFHDSVGTFRFVDAPPAEVAEALASAHPDMLQMRPNEQPPAGRELLGALPDLPIFGLWWD